jgi:hypothetical protein
MRQQQEAQIRQQQEALLRQQQEAQMRQQQEAQMRQQERLQQQEMQMRLQQAQMREMQRQQQELVYRQQQQQQQQEFRQQKSQYGYGNSSNNNNNNNNRGPNRDREQQYQPYQKQPRPITLGDMLPPNLFGKGRPTTSNKQSGYYQQGSRWTESKEMMSADEIDAIIRMQNAQLHSNHPFIDDYYYYQLQHKKQTAPLSRDEPVDIMHQHKPLCESAPTRTFPPKKIINDPLAGVLGRIPTHSVRAPRPLLQLREQEERGESGDAEDTEEAARTAHAGQAVLLAIENAFNHLLDIEDIDLILGGASVNQNFNVAPLLAKRDALTADLFRALQMDGYPLTKQTPPVPVTTQKTTYASKLPRVVAEDEFFVSISLISKGKRLLARSLPLFSATLAVPVLLSFMRNLYYFLLTSSSPASGNPGSTSQKRILSGVGALIQGVPVPDMLLAFHMMMQFHADTLPKLVQFGSGEGAAMLLAFLRRGHELTQQGGGPDAPHAFPTAHWRVMYGEFFNKLEGGRILANSLKTPGQNAQLVNTLWDVTLAVVADADQRQRIEISDRLREVVLTSDATQARHIRTFLQIM